MKNNNVHIRFTIASIVACFFAFQQLNADRVITFFFEPYPVDEVHAQKLSNKLQKPGHVAKCMINGYACYSQVAGIYSTYAGYITTSDIYGETVFPKKQENPSFDIIITPAVTPIFMFANTISHWQIENPFPVAAYHVERKQDQVTHLFFWKVSEAPKPADNIIGRDAIIIIADPDDIVIPEGITMTNKTPNLVLPPIYVKKGHKATNHALYMLELNYLFGPVKKLDKKAPKILDTLVH